MIDDTAPQRMTIEQFIARYPFIANSEEAREVLRIAAPPGDIGSEYVLHWLSREDYTPELVAYKFSTTHKRLYGCV